MCCVSERKYLLFLYFLIFESNCFSIDLARITDYVIFLTSYRTNRLVVVDNARRRCRRRGAALVKIIHAKIATVLPECCYFCPFYSKALPAYLKCSTVGKEGGAAREHTQGYSYAVVIPMAFFVQGNSDMYRCASKCDLSYMITSVTLAGW